MKLTVMLPSLLLAAGGSTFAAAQTAAPSSADHVMVTAQEIKWSAAPASLPKGAEISLLHGDPSKNGLFVMRLKMPAGYTIPPHKHPGTEVVTVISGTFHLGMGEAAEKSKAKALPAGSLFVFPPGMAHFAHVDQETIVQISTTGPWGVDYINPQDDPRKAPK